MLHAQYGLQVCRWLPVQEQSAERRKGFWKTLFDSFEQIDGKHDFEVECTNLVYMYVHMYLCDLYS